MVVSLCVVVVAGRAHGKSLGKGTAGLGRDAYPFCNGGREREGNVSCGLCADVVAKLGCEVVGSVVERGKRPFPCC